MIDPMPLLSIKQFSIKEFSTKRRSSSPGKVIGVCSLLLVACSSNENSTPYPTDSGTTGASTSAAGATLTTAGTGTTGSTAPASAASTTGGVSTTGAQAVASSSVTGSTTQGATLGTSGGTDTSSSVTTGGDTASGTTSGTASASTTGGAVTTGAGGSTSAATTATVNNTTATSTTGSGDCTPQVDCNPEVLPSTGDIYQDCVDRVNQFRVDCWCMPALERWTEAESCADEQAQYDFEMDEPHAGISDGICSPGGNGQNECPGWGSPEQVIEGCLQSMYDEGPPPSDPCDGQCFQDHGHFLNMTNEGSSRVACGFYTTPEGDVWAVQNFE